MLLAVTPVVMIGPVPPAAAHDRETTSVTWNRTVSRIVFERCGACHRDGGVAFSLLTYDQARPWAVAIRDEVLARTMPPWGAIKGFGEFRSDQALSPAQINLIVSWVEGGVPRGRPSDVVAAPPEYGAREVLTSPPSGALIVSGDFLIEETFILDGFWPVTVPPEASFQIVAELPDGNVRPLLWLHEYREAYSRHAFRLKEPLTLPPGARILGVPSHARVALLPVPSPED